MSGIDQSKLNRAVAHARAVAFREAAKIADQVAENLRAICAKTRNPMVTHELASRALAAEDIAEELRRVAEEVGP